MLKFAPKEAHIDGLMGGHLSIKATDYHHALPDAQRDSLEASLAFGMSIYANWLLPIYCIFMV